MEDSTVPDADPCVVLIFGASGDLTARKLVPALYELDRQGRLPEGTCVLGVSRTKYTDDAFRERLTPMVREHASGFDEQRWSEFASRIHYEPGDATKADSFKSIIERADRVGAEHGINCDAGGPNLLMYLSVAPFLYEPIVNAAGEAEVVTERRRWCSLNESKTAWQRIIVEKPFGEDLESALELNRVLGRVFDEDMIFRIDHYLAKELVQNILVLRFANSIFEPIWNQAHIDHVQVTAAESIGVGSRAANFYDQAGALRDMVQSHLLQVLALVAMEPPSVYGAGEIASEKSKVLDAAVVCDAKRAHEFGVFGRYAGGDGDRAYVDEASVDAGRKTETYAALRLDFDNWRWAGVPFYVRSGKKMAKKCTEIVVQFKDAPTNLFRGLNGNVGRQQTNRMVIRVAPKEEISIRVSGKVPGPGLKIATADLDLDYLDVFGGERVEAYGPLLLDAMRGDRTLFKHRDEVESGWRLCQPFLDSERLREEIEDYASGSWGPAGADVMLGGAGRVWHNE
ncbi:MAG: glucose-6-phosphate dehydrogenase [Planctomycetota bacterium]